MWENSQSSSKPQNCENKSSEIFLISSPNWDLLMIHFSLLLSFFLFKQKKNDLIMNEKKSLLAYILERVVKNYKFKIYLLILVVVYICISISIYSRDTLIKKKSTLKL